MGAKERIYPNSITADNANFSVTGAPTKWEAIDDPFDVLNIADYIVCGVDGQEIRFGFQNTSAAIGNDTVINFIDIVYVAGPEGVTYSGQELTAFVRSGGVHQYDDWRTALGFRTWRKTLGADSTGAAWNKTKLDAIEGGFAHRDLTVPVDANKYAQLYIEIDFVADPRLLGAARAVTSHILWARRRLFEQIKGRNPFVALDVPLLGISQWTHGAVPRPTDTGAGMKRWEREAGLVLAHEIHPGLPGIPVTVEGFRIARHWLHSWDAMISEEPPGGSSPGIPRLNAGAGRLFARASDAWVENAAAAAQGLLQLVKLPADIEKNTTDGELLEGAATNLVTNPAFSNTTGSPFQGWTTSAVTADTADVITEAGDSLQSAKFTRVGVGNARAEQAFSLAASTAYFASLYHKDDSGVKLQLQVIRASDGFYWNGGSTWQVGAVAHDFPVRSSTDRDAIGPIIKDGATGNVTFRILAESGSGQINHAYHFQVEANRWPSSPILVSGGTRALDNLRLANFSGKRYVPVDQGHIRLAFQTNWSAVNQTTNRQIFKAYYDASNWIELFYAAVAGELRFRRRVGGTNKTASFVLAITAGTLYTVTCRTTGADGEHGLTPYTISLFVNGVKGTDDVSAAFGALAADPLYVYTGQEETNTNHLEGTLRFWEAKPYVPSDEEIAGEDG